MSGFIGEIPKRVSRGWFSIPDKSNIIMEKIIEDISYVEIEAESGSYRIIEDGEFIRDPVTRKIKQTFKYTYYNYGDNPESIYVKDVLKSTYVKLDNGVEYTYPEYLDFESGSPLDISHIYSEVRTERTEIHPHFGSKQVSIKNAWIGTENGNKQVLKARDYFIDQFDNHQILLPTSSSKRTSCIFNNELHMIFYDSVNKVLKHYVTSDYRDWIAKEDYTISNEYESAFDNYLSSVVYNNQIHLFIPDSEVFLHYIYDDVNDDWVESVHLAISRKTPRGGPRIIVYNNEIHLISLCYDWDGQTYPTIHYKLENGSTWLYIEDLTFLDDNIFCNVAVYNNQIHTIFADSGRTRSLKHYYYNGTRWTAIGTNYLPSGYTYYNANEYSNYPFILNDMMCIYIFRDFWYYNGTKWTKDDAYYLSIQMSDNLISYIHNNKINILENNIHFNHLVPFYRNEWFSDYYIAVDFDIINCYNYNEKLYIYSNRTGKLLYYDKESDKWLLESVPSIVVNSAYLGDLIIFKNKFYIFFNTNPTYLVYDGTLWFEKQHSVSTNFFVVSTNDNLYIIPCGYTPLNKIYYLENDTFVEKSSSLNLYYENSNAFSFNNELYAAINTNIPTSEGPTYLYKYDKINNEWIQMDLESSPKTSLQNACYKEYKGKLHVFGTSTKGSIITPYHYVFDGRTWVDGFKLPDNIRFKYQPVANELAIFDHEIMIPYDKTTGDNLSYLKTNYYYGYF